MDEVLALLAELAERSGEVRSMHVLVRYRGQDDFDSAYTTDDTADLAFQLGSEVIRLRGG